MKGGGFGAITNDALKFKKFIKFKSLRLVIFLASTYLVTDNFIITK